MVCFGAISDVTPPYHIRTAEKSDLAPLQEIERAAATIFPEGRLPDVDDVMPMRELEKANDRGLVLVAARGDEVVGFAMSEEWDVHLHLAVIAVHPDHGQRGVGSQLVAAVIRQAGERRLSGVTLTTFRDLPWNAPFYAKAGFHVLDDAELNPRLRAILTREERLGMTNRVAMLYPNVG